MSGAKRRVLAVHKLTGDIVGEYESAQSAAERNGYNVGYVAKSARDSQLARGWVCFRYEQTYEPNERLQGRMNCPVVVYKDGKMVAQYPSRVDAASAFHVCTDTFNKHVRDKTPLKGCEIREVEYMGQLGGRLKHAEGF